MAIIIDDQARATIARCRAQGHDASVLLRVAIVPVRGMHRTLEVGWVPSDSRESLEERRVGDVVLYLDDHVARYTHWRDITISARRFGPIDHLVIVDDLLVLLQMQEWERAHPYPGRPSES